MKHERRGHWTPLPPGTGLSLYHLLELEKLNEASVALLQNVRSQKSGKKDIIKIEGDISGLNFDVLGYVDPQISLTFIENGHVTRKVRPDQPKRLVNVIKCTNPRCITSLETGLRPHLCPDPQRTLPLRLL